MTDYENEEAILTDFKKLNADYKTKAGRYIKNLLKLQRAEAVVKAELHTLNVKRTREYMNSHEGYSCNFCGKGEDEVFRMIVGQGKNCICDECANLCREVLEEIRAETQ